MGSQASRLQVSPIFIKKLSRVPKQGISGFLCADSLSLEFQPGSRFVHEPYVCKANLWNPPALLFWGGYCAVPLGTRISADVPSRSPAQVLSERVTAWKAERRSLKRIKIGLISKLGTVPDLFVLIHTRFINIEWWLLFSEGVEHLSFLSMWGRVLHTQWGFLEEKTPQRMLAEWPA